MFETTRKESMFGVTTRAAVAAAALLLTGAVQAAGDAASGKALFDKTCANCHSIEAGVNKVGPTLFDIVGRPIASVPGYQYSRKMRDASKEWKAWDEHHLNVYLTHPRQVLHGVNMFFAVPDPRARADVIVYLNTLR